MNGSDSLFNSNHSTISVEPPRQPVGQPAGPAAAEVVSAAVDRTEIQEDLESITEVDEDNLTHSASDASVSVSEIDNKHKGNPCNPVYETKCQLEI